ncbi:MAG: preQ(1) synthase [Pseudomonadota bacterium]|nr:preQ(1) synthase [Pseudomonadota bacterium]
MSAQKQSKSASLPSKLETFNNPNPSSDYSIRIKIPEFTCLCPKTGQPDFATLHFDYIPDNLCVELKSLKLYIWSFRNVDAFHESVTHEILNNLIELLNPRYARLTARFNVRGGIHTEVIIRHQSPVWTPKTNEAIPPPVANQD